MRTLNKLLLMLLVLAALGSVVPVQAGENLDSTPPTADWRFAGPRIRTRVQADSLWDILLPVWQESLLNTLLNSGWF